ncbi:hypothetical protein EMEDMD4_180087 [Sinorhizobium medicae]|uniref:Uncharacterized protein n=1 Tax=Sinorhizobium medicae TaxID=110321 RepID=A0A508WYK0_9HYPH|nr:hypothetical protein EMEDMD4_180087 [Sinorhizobium medicae]
MASRPAGGAAQVLLACPGAADVPSLICMRYALLASLVDRPARLFFARSGAGACIWMKKLVPGFRAAAASQRIVVRGADRSGLTLRDMDYESVQSFAHLDLTGETRRRTHIIGEVQHILFHRFGSADLSRPGIVDIDVTGRTGTGAAALGFDPGDRIANCILHDRGPILDIEFVARAVKGYDRKFCHFSFRNELKKGPAGWHMALFG